MFMNLDLWQPPTHNSSTVIKLDREGLRERNRIDQGILI